MSNKDFEVKQILKAYRKGIISESMLQEQMEELSKGGLNVANVLVHKGTQVAAETLTLASELGLLLQRQQCSRDRLHQVTASTTPWTDSRQSQSLS